MHVPLAILLVLRWALAYHPAMVSLAVPVTVDGNEEPVEIVPHDDAWAEKFEVEKASIQDAFREIAVEVHHIGSTPVPGLVAKPIIDIMIAVDSLEDRPTILQSLSSIGYTYVPYEGDAERLYCRKGTPRMYHAHVVRRNSWTYWRHLLFRDALISDPRLRADYERLKLELAARFRDDREAYTDAKGEFIEAAVSNRVLGRRP